MDFEVITTAESEKNFFTELEAFFRHRRRQLQDWEAKPPYLVGYFVLLAVSFEIALGWHLGHERTLSRDIIPEFIFIGFFILMAELALAKVGQEVGEIFKKKGKFSTTLTFFNLGLIPFLLVLPITLLNQVLPHLELLSLVAVLFIISQVFSNFREALEVSFEFSRLQSAVVLYLSGGLISVGILIAVYISFFGLISELLTNL